MTDPKRNHTLHQQLRSQISEIGTLLSRLLKQALVALERRDPGLARELNETLEHLHGREDASRDACLRILALTQGNTEQLRWTNSAHRILGLMAESSQEIESIARDVERIDPAPDLPLARDLPAMGREAGWMLEGSIRTTLEPDMEDARRIIAADSGLDRSRDAFLQKADAFLSRHPEARQPAIPYLSISQRLERIGDHASHIAEEIVYYLDERAA